MARERLAFTHFIQTTGQSAATPGKIKARNDQGACAAEGSIVPTLLDTNQTVKTQPIPE